MQSLYLVAILSVAWLVLCVFMWRLHRSKLYRSPEHNASILITYASQTGNAQAIGERCAKALNLSEKSSVIALNTLTLEHLSHIEKILFVVSTYGNGEAPDNGSMFTKLSKVLSSQRLNHLQYSVIALGDSAYPEFCAFGHKINKTMLTTGAQLLGDVITVDNYDEQKTELVNITPDWIKINLKPERIPTEISTVKSTQYWQLVKRELLNPHCNNEKLFQLSFQSIGPAPIWQAGDLIDIQPHHPADIVDRWLLENNFDGNTCLTYQGHTQTLKAWLLARELPTLCSYSLDELLNKLPYLHKRSYSVASVSQEGKLQLIVRLFEKECVNNVEMVTETATYGLASGFLSYYCQVGNIVEGHIRDISSHHNIDQSKPIILIGSGSGLAGLKSQIAARTLSKSTLAAASWLVYGERNSNLDLPINKLLATLEKTQLTKLSYAFSQDKKYPKYVQDVLLKEQATLKQWIDDGAIIYVCGCLSGMGEGVHQALTDILGQSMLEALQLQQRYIRDVY